MPTKKKQTAKKAEPKKKVNDEKLRQRAKNLDACADEVKKVLEKFGVKCPFAYFEDGDFGLLMGFKGGPIGIIRGIDQMQKADHIKPAFAIIGMKNTLGL